MARCAGGVCDIPGNNMAMGSVGLQNIGGKKDRLGQLAQFPQFDPQQMGLLNQLGLLTQNQLKQAGGPLGQSPLNNNWQQYFNFAPIEAQARNQFQTQTIPSLAERFTAMGGEGGQRSSAFQAALGNAGSQLEQGLAALKAQYALPQAQLAQNQQQLGLSQRGQQLDLLRTLLGGALNQRFENAYIPRQPSAWGQFLGQAAGGIARGAAQALPLAFL